MVVNKNMFCGSDDTVVKPTKKQLKCHHQFIHAVMKTWFAAETIIYCKYCAIRDYQV